MKKLFLIICFLFLIYPASSKAEDIQSASASITVTPPKFQLWANPGDKLTEYLRITNESDQAAIMALSLDDFIAASDDGSVVLGQNFSLPNQLRSWINFDQKGFEFKPHETKLISYKIDVPSGAYSGGNYAAIVVSMDKLHREAGDEAAVAKVVSMVMLTVSGDIRDAAFLTDFSLKKAQKENKDVFNFILKLKNGGNNHIRPRGTIVVTNFFGKKVGEVALTEENILPNISRVVTSSWKPNKMLFGRYNANLISIYGYKEDKKISGSFHFYAFSKTGIGIAVVFLSLLGFLVFVFRRRIFKKKISN